MRDAILKIFLLQLWFIATPQIQARSGDEVIPTVTKDLNIFWMVAKVEADGPSQIYGTAVLIGANAQKLTFLTNAHIVSENPEIWQKLRLRSPFNHYKKSAAKLRAVSYGYDLAILEIDNESRIFSLEKINAFLSSSWNLESLENQTVQAAIIGIPGWPQYSQELMPALFNWVVTPEGIGTVVNKASLSSPFRIVQPSVCPTVFHTHCYEVPFLTWGFSGGIFLAQRTNKNGTKGPEQISGMVSHFKPGSALSLVIPSIDALGVAAELLKRSEDASQPFLWKSDLGNHFEFDHINRKVIGISSATADMTISLDHTIAPGGGFIGSGGGGFIGSGGGGFIGSDGGGIIGNQKGVTAFIGNYQKLNDLMMHPSTWQTNSNIKDFLDSSSFFRGISHFFSFNPQITIKYQGENKTINRFNGVDLINAHQLIQTCLKQGASIDQMSYEPGSIRPIHRRASPTGRAAGILNEVLVRRFKSPKEIQETLKSNNIINDTGYTNLAEELGPLIKDHATDNGDLMISGLPNTSAMIDSDLTMSPTEFRVNFSNDARKHLRASYIQTAGPLVALSDHFYRYFGKLNIAEEEWHGAVFVEIDPKNQEIEIHIIWSDRLKEGLPKNGFLVPEAMRLRSLHLIYQ